MSLLHPRILLVALVAGCTFNERPVEPVPTPIPLPPDVEREEPTSLPSPPVVADHALPAVSGGTLAVNDVHVVAADPRRDTLWIARSVGVETLVLEGDVDLGEGAQPGRVLLERARAFVVLGGTGEVAEVDLEAREIVRREEVCEAPRGIARDGEELLVTCVGGELLRLDAELAVVTRTSLKPDLRDVVVQEDRVWVSVFRSGEILELRGDEVLSHELPPFARDRVARVAWRMIDADGTGVYVLHQQMSTQNFVSPEEGEERFGEDLGGPFGGYGSEGTLPQDRIVVSAVAWVGDEARVLTVDAAPLAVDLAMQDRTVLLASAAVPSRESDQAPGVRTAVRSFAGESTPWPSTHEGDALVSESVAVRGSRVFAFYPRAGQLATWTGSEVVRVRLAPEVVDTGHDVFHANTQASVACASCHPAGRDDGHVWTFDFQPRRTQPLTGGVMSTTPFHWAGDQPDLGAIMESGFDTRMRGPVLDEAQVAAVGAWLDTLPAQRVAVDDGLAAEGADEYEANRCADCHGSDAPPSGIDGILAPRLEGVGVRAPYFHDGCAATLEEALAEPCVHTHPRIEDPEALAAYLAQL